MAILRGERHAFGWPGIEPRWTAGSKDGVGTAYADVSKVWFTLWRGILTEIYWPSVDSPQTRDLQFLITDGETFFHEEKRDLIMEIDRLGPHVLGYRIRNSDPEGRYSIEKEIVADPRFPCILQRTELHANEALAGKLKLFLLFAPHMDRGGNGNDAFIIQHAGRDLLVSHKDGSWCAIGGTVPFAKLSCGFVGASDGWTDVAEHLEMAWEFDQALNGNVALTAEIDTSKATEFTIGIAFGHSLQSAVATLFQTLGFPFESCRTMAITDWKEAENLFLPLGTLASDGGKLYASSTSLLIAHEDKTFAGAFIASLSIPWGEMKGDEDLGGYHLVWTRDLVNTAMGLLAAGEHDIALRALIYIAATQPEDGGFPQNFWVNGEGYWSGIQLDEVAFPVLLARRLAIEGGLRDFDPYPMVLLAASYLVIHGPATQQERWEESSGYSPSTLAAVIAALIAVACFADEHNDAESANFIRDYADFLESNLESWTVTNNGTLVEGIPRHYIRILPVDIDDPTADEDPDSAILSLKNQEPGAQTEYPAKEIVDGGFLELVRYGIRAADDPLIVDSVKVIDEILRKETPKGPGFYRYNHDGYGQRDDGTGFDDWGRGRLWPLLTGERAHYELAAGRDPKPYREAMERFATDTGLLSEQVWDSEEVVDWLHFGLPTGAAMPLCWVHAEYIRLLRSIRDGKMFGFVPEVAERYIENRGNREAIEIWKPNRHARSVRKSETLRIQAPEPFVLHWTLDDWSNRFETRSTPTKLGVEFVDIRPGKSMGGPIGFTFFWFERDEWEGTNYEVKTTK
ncbi:MAG: glycoside hydrolase family 15 protein [Candidatus Kapaibacterium sp.]